MKKVKFITSIYSDLHGTEFGGRPSRGGHYRWSLLSLLKMTDADFVCYTSEKEYNSLVEFFYKRHSVDQNQFKIEVFDLKKSPFYDELYQIKNQRLSEFINSDRCLEIQYNKFFWFDLEVGEYEYYFWIDAGLSHCGLLPDKWLPYKDMESRWYNSDIFDNKFLENLLKFTSDKIFIIAKDNVRNYWSGTVNPKYYTKYDSSRHIIGGLFGGKKENFRKLVDNFKNYLSILLSDGLTPSEENILSLINVNESEFFIRKYFDTWWCPDNAPKDLSDQYFIDNKSFYKVLEEIINDE